MTYVIIDGDDVGRRVTAFYLGNDEAGLSAFISNLQTQLEAIAGLLQSAGFLVIFSAADGVAVRGDTPSLDDTEIYERIESIAGGSGLSFSVGVGASLREAYVALLSAKSNGKAHLRNYRDMI